MVSHHPPRLVQRGIFVLGIISLLVSACGHAPTRPIATYVPTMAAPVASSTPVQVPQLPGWLLQWDDEFDGNTLNGQHWTVADSITRTYLGCCLRFGAQSWDTNAVTVKDGLLHIVTKRAKTGGYTFTSGALSTEYTYALLYGRIDVRAQMPRSTSLWPAFWLIPADTQGQRVASYEIDFAEAWESDPHTVYAFFHKGYAQTYCQAQGPDFTAGFHVFSLIWTTSELQWLIDGQPQCTQTAYIPDIPMALIVDTAIGGDNEPVDQSTLLPQTTAIDYVRIWVHR